MTNLERGIIVHDLYREFAKLEAEGILDERANFKKRMWVYYEDSFPMELEMTPSHRCWQKLIQICIKESFGQQNLLQSLQGIEWSNCSNVVVLKLERLKSLRVDLNLHGLKCMRSLELRNISKLDSLNGIQDLNHLTYFCWIVDEYVNHDLKTRIEQLPSSLKVVYLRGSFFLSPETFTRCINLLNLQVIECRVQDLDFSNCKRLHTVSFTFLKMFGTLGGLAAASTPNLQSVEVYYCEDLLEILGLGELVGLQSLCLVGNSSLQRLPNLQKLSKLEVLELSDTEIEAVPGLGCLCQLPEMICHFISQPKLPSLSALKQLRVVDFSLSSELSSLEGVLFDLPALRSLNLSHCSALKQLQDLRGMRSLEELDLVKSGIEIGEDDLCMLATLPLFAPCAYWLLWHVLQVGRGEAEGVEIGTKFLLERQVAGERFGCASHQSCRHSSRAMGLD